MVDTRRLLLATDDWWQYKGERSDAWRMLLRFDDVDDMLRLNYERRMFLARYGKQSVLQWDEVPVTEIIRYVEALTSLLKQESATTKLTEDA